MSAMEVVKQGSAPNSPVSRKRKMPGADTQVPGEFLRTLLDTRAEAFAIEGKPENMPIFICKRDDLVIDVWQGLIEKNFLSVPVLLKNHDSYFGVFDMGDVLKYIVDQMGKPLLLQSKNYLALMREHETFKDKKVKDLMDWPLSRKNPFRPVEKGFSALNVIELLAKVPDLHRVPIIAPNREMLNFVTQSQICRYLRDNVDALGAKKDKLVSQCPQFYRDDVVSVDTKSTAIEAFMLMANKKISGVAVVDQELHLKGHLSMRDLKLIGNDGHMFMRLGEHVDNFIIKLRKEYQAKHSRPRTMVAAYGKDTLATVIQKCADNSVHRLFVCKSYKEKTVQGVISLKDLLAEIIA